MQFQWNNLKNRTNTLKHGICFEEAQKAFSDPNRIILDDPKHSTEDEKRYWLIGQAEGSILIIVYTIRLKYIRIISARLANRKERDAYEKSKTEIGE